jgi:hypothetical protein
MRSKIIVLAALILAGCATQPSVTVVSVQNGGDPSKIKGIPFRLKAAQIVRTFHWDPAAQDYVEVSSTEQAFADMSRLYALDVKSYPFASPGLRITENSDNTLKEIEVTGTDNSNGGITALNSAVTAIPSANAARVTARATQTTAEQTALTAYKTALSAQEQLPSTASQADQAVAQALVTSTKQQVMQAYQAAGDPPPAL